MGQDIIVYKSKPRVVFKGVAVGDGWTGGRIVKVQLSFDGGKTWNDAKIHAREKKGEDEKVFSWVQWKYVMPIDMKEKHKKISALVRAYDSTGHNQEHTMEDIMNLWGTFVNHPHKVYFNYHIIE